VTCNKFEETEKALATIYKQEIKVRVDELIKERDYVNSKGEVRLLDLFTKKYRKAMFVGIVMMSMQQLTGLNILMVFSTKIFGAGINDQNDVLPLTLSIVFAAINHLFTYCLIFLTGKFGRKALLSTGTLLLGLVELCFAVIALASSPESIASKIALLFWPLPFGISLGSVVFVMVSESLPEIGASVALLFNWIAGFLTVQFFPNISDAIGIDVTFLIIGSITIAAAVFFWINVVESRGKDKADILRSYNGIVENESKNMETFKIEAKETMPTQNDNNHFTLKELDIIPISTQPSTSTTL
jgi:SP family sugar porter-like MFS transporter